MPDRSKLSRAAGLYRAGRAPQAEALLREVLVADPESADALFFLGSIAVDRGRMRAALKLLRAALARRPLQGEFHAALGNALSLAGRHEEALGCYRMALALEPRMSGLRRNIGHALHELSAALLAQGRHAQAAEHLRQLVDERPDDAGARSDFGLALLGLDRPEEATAQLREALRLAPRHWQALHNLGLAELRRGGLEQGLVALEQARSLRPDNVDVLTNLGYLYCLARNFERGEPLLRQAAALDPAHRRARRNLGLYLLGRGRFEEGWQHRMEKWDAVKLGKRGLIFPQPWWDGEPLAGRRLLVWSEQGLGDQIMFCSTVPDILRMRAEVVLECAPRLERLFARSFPHATVVPRGNDSHATIERLSPQLQAPMSRLPVFLRRSREAFPRHRGYLQASPVRVAYWRSRLEALGSGPKIGVSWAGGTVKTGRGRRSTVLEDWLPVLCLPGVRYVSLQYTDCRDELARLRDAHGIDMAHWQEAIDDYDETAALVTALDAVASVCTSVIHLAGALGKPTWVLVPWWPAWRYMLEGEEMPWYPSVVLVRQERAGDWRTPLERLARSLQRLAA